MMFFVKDKLSSKQEEGVVKSEHKPYTGTAGMKRFYQSFLFYDVCILQYIHLLFFLSLLSPGTRKSYITQGILCPGRKLLCRNPLICMMNLWIPLWISTVCGRYSWLESDGLWRTSIKRRISFPPHLSSQVAMKFFLCVLFTYSKKPFCSYHVWSESKSADKKGANSKKKKTKNLAALQKHSLNHSARQILTVAFLYEIWIL